MSHCIQQKYFCTSSKQVLFHIVLVTAPTHSDLPPEEISIIYKNEESVWRDTRNRKEKRKYIEENVKAQSRSRLIIVGQR